MARKREGIQTRRQKKKEKKEKRAESELEDVVIETAATFTCSHETARDFTWQCTHNLDELETDILFNRLAHKVWENHTGAAKELAGVLAAFLAEREHYHDRLMDFQAQFNLLADAETHEHLESIETYRAIIREGLSFKNEK